jgi:hypothetical protein
LQIAIAISFFGSIAWLWILQSLLPFAWPLLLGRKGSPLGFIDLTSYWTIIWLWVFFNTGLNIYCGNRFAKPDWRAWNIKRSPQKRALVARQLVRKLTTRKQLSTIGRAGWKVDFFQCDARIDWREFPDDSIAASCVGTDSKDWIWIRFNDARYQKHYCIFGDLGYGKENFVRVLVKAALGDPNTAIVIADSDEATGFSFAEYENINNVALAVGIEKSKLAIQAVWNELRRRIAERTMGAGKTWSRLVLVLDEMNAAGIYGFWRKSFRDRDESDSLRRISRLLKEIVDSGKLHNIHVIGVLDNGKLDFFAWSVMRDRFESFATFFKRKFTSKKKGEIISEIVQTHEYPFMDMLSVVWQGDIIMMKAPYLPEQDFIQYVQARSIYLSTNMKTFLDDIRFSKIGESKP